MKPRTDPGTFFSGFQVAGEHYLFAYDNAHRWDVIRTLGRWALDPGISLTARQAGTAAEKLLDAWKEADAEEEAEQEAEYERQQRLRECE